MRSAAIILAAGFSSRMENFKPLITIEGETITDRVISTYQQNGIETYLVVGYQQDKLLTSIKNKNIRVVENPDYSQGMFSSIQAGLRNLPGGIEFFFIVPVDIPLVRPFTIKRMMEKAKENPGKIIYPEFKRTRGHPTIIPIQIVPAVLSWKREGGLKSVLDSHENLALSVAVPDRYILFDIDTPEDYRMMLESFSHYWIPTQEECEVILANIGSVSEEIRRHCFKVADVAVKIGQALKVSNISLDLDAILAGALLHDILRAQHDHAALSGRWLSEMGFSGIAEIVAAHTDLPAGIRISLEAKVVYLADKYVKGDTIVSLEDRFQSAFQRFGTDYRVKAKIWRRLQSALDVRNEIEVMQGRSVEKVIFT